MRLLRIFVTAFFVIVSVNAIAQPQPDVPDNFLGTCGAIWDIDWCQRYSFCVWNPQLQHCAQRGHYYRRCLENCAKHHPTLDRCPTLCRPPADISPQPTLVSPPTEAKRPPPPTPQPAKEPDYLQDFVQASLALARSLAIKAFTLHAAIGAALILALALVYRWRCLALM